CGLPDFFLASSACCNTDTIFKNNGRGTPTSRLNSPSLNLVKFSYFMGSVETLFYFRRSSINVALNNLGIVVEQLTEVLWKHIYIRDKDNYPSRLHKCDSNNTQRHY